MVWFALSPIPENRLMKSPAILLTLAAAAAVCPLTSCATAGKKSMAFMEKTTSGATTKIAELAQAAGDKIRPARIPVVAVREQDLKKMPTGEERALAFESKRRKRSWFFSGPVDFQEPTLPEIGGGMDGSLLPPKNP